MSAKLVTASRFRDSPSRACRFGFSARPALLRWLWPLLLAALCYSHPAQAGRSCEPKTHDLANVTKAMNLAHKSWLVLEQSGAQVAMIARVGQDLSKYGLRYSHMGLIWRDHPDGRWLVVHELNTCGTAESALYDEGLGNFFLDDMFSYETEILIPSPATQARLAQFLASSHALRLHDPHYNMLAYPFSTRYQNSNQWLLESYAVALAGGPEGRGQGSTGQDNTRQAAQAWLQSNGYTPITVSLPTLTRLGARIFRANVEFDDHPFGRRMAGQIDTVTVDSVLRFVKQREPEAQSVVLQ
jgi:hypothetical protein